MSNTTHDIEVPEDLPDHQDQRAEFFDHQTGAFFRGGDWVAFWTVWLFAFSLYLYTLAPSVTLEDSGELTVAADNMGVPHPPGYPTWTLLAWFFQWIAHDVRYHGYPNPSWAVALLSAVCASLACAIVAILVSRSGADIMRGMRRATEVLGLKTESAICCTAGIAAGLLLAVSPVLWSQAVIVEVYALNVFFLSLVLLLTYRWVSRPGEDVTLYVAAYVFGHGLTNHHTLLFAALALLVAIGFRDRPLFRDVCAVLSLLLAALLFYRADGSTVVQMFGLLFLLAPVGILIFQGRLFTEWRRILLCGALIALGLSFYLYMPLASEQNPAHNWGNTRTVEGFKHAITRGQYERISPTDVFGNFEFFRAQVHANFLYLKNIFTVPILLLALVPFFFFRQIHSRARAWLYTLLVAFFSLSIMLTIFLNPTLDLQTLYIQRRFFIPSHAMLCIWLGYAIVFLLSQLEMRLPRGMISYLGLALAAILPLTLLHRNFYHEEQIRVIGGAEQRGHDFGWQFGHWQMRGVNGIREDLQRIYGDDFDEVWAAYPNPNYPPELEQDAIFFGGTDPGRFVPTYMIFSAKCREDVYLITQNALADNTYMAVMRDLYGDRIWIPSLNDSNSAFRQMMDQVNRGEIPPGVQVTTSEDGRMSVQGVAGVMIINGILTRMIFEQNKHKHPFYVEESYVIPWMYPYLKPHGLIMKLHSESVTFTQRMVDNDRAFWDWYTERLVGNPRFLRDIVARKTFSKLRGSIAGLFAYHGLHDDAEYAFKQALELYPLSPEACFRLADMYQGQRRFDEAIEVLQGLLDGDPDNHRVQEFMDQIENLRRVHERRAYLEGLANEGALDLQVALELFDVYAQFRMQPQMDHIARSLLGNDEIPVDVYMQIAQRMGSMGRLDMVEHALQCYLMRVPNVPNVWFELGAVRTAQGKQGEAMQALRRAVQLGGDPVREQLAKDQRLTPLHQRADFRELAPAPVEQPAPREIRLPFSGM